ncbi:sulfurtransferase [Streptomyces spongiae]|uniref:Sulfurtransferase n=1 Tax=Streptomyces spongiae TaxID=565072 RepID=A0A5N8XXS9_9ACTN|nr:rhodanese-like domain-containing protein [Streptomyces spongiae]MPY64177.1 sulfurtransferase [Streptomyces spongiae]
MHTAFETVPVLVTAAELHSLPATGGPAPVLLDVRWEEGDPHGRERYLKEHIPGAVYVDLDTELAAPPAPDAGRHPLPDPAALQDAARRWGVTVGRTVVVYDDRGNTAAARAWWLLRWAGVEHVVLLDGALDAWRAAGLPTETGEPEHLPVPGDIVLTPGHLPVLDADAAADVARTGVLLDVRPAERHRSENQPAELRAEFRAGRIPGALSAPTGDNLAPDGTFRDVEELALRFTALGADDATEVGVHGGSGISAAHTIAALAHAGIPAALCLTPWTL